MPLTSRVRGCRPPWCPSPTLQEVLSIFNQLKFPPWPLIVLSHCQFQLHHCCGHYVRNGMLLWMSAPLTLLVVSIISHQGKPLLAAPANPSQRQASSGSPFLRGFGLSFHVLWIKFVSDVFLPFFRNVPTSLGLRPHSPSRLQWDNSLFLTFVLRLMCYYFVFLSQWG